MDINSKQKSRWQFVVILIGILVVVVMGGLIIANSNSTGGLKNPLQKSQGVTNKLDGTKVDKESASRHPLAIIIENHPDARPQYGLSQASIVYEAIAEGGITRFLAIFGPREASKVGPVRSARTYFIDWLSEYDAYFAHVGGNLDALEQIKQDDIFDLDQFGLGEPTYWRSPRPGIAIEHTMFTDTNLLYKAAANRNYPIGSNFKALKFKEASKPASESQQIEIDFSETSYKVKWIFDPDSDSYLRQLAGVPHLDAANGNQLAAKNIIIQEVTRHDAPTAIGEQGWAMDAIGSGKAKIFMEGQEIDGTWEKTTRTDRTIFYDNGGSEIKFIPGQFWYEITPPEVFSKITIN